MSQLSDMQAKIQVILEYYSKVDILERKKVLENHVEFEGFRSERSHIFDLLILQRPRIFHIFSPFQHRLSISRIRVYLKLDFTFLKLKSMLVVQGTVFKLFRTLWAVRQTPGMLGSCRGCFLELSQLSIHYCCEYRWGKCSRGKGELPVLGGYQPLPSIPSPTAPRPRQMTRSSKQEPQGEANSVGKPMFQWTPFGRAGDGFQPSSLPRLIPSPDVLVSFIPLN